jgi:hypothetical protein
VLGLLLAPGCDSLQGYYFSRPVPAGAVPALLRQQSQEVAAGHGPLPRMAEFSIGQVFYRPDSGIGPISRMAPDFYSQAFMKGKNR